MYLGIDYGKKRIGLALGQMLPNGVGVLDGTKKMEETIASISLICRENDVDKIVIGMPILPSGDKTELSFEVEKFGLQLTKATKIPVVFEEEQFTSTEAEDILRRSGHVINKKTGSIDEMAAVLILEQYINRIAKK